MAPDLDGPPILLILLIFLTRMGGQEVRSMGADLDGPPMLHMFHMLHTKI
jgi:hypothetical protein